MPRQLVPYVATHVRHKIKRKPTMRFRLFPCVLMVTTITTLALLTMAIIGWSSGLRSDRLPPSSEENSSVDAVPTESIAEHAQLLANDPEEARAFDPNLGERDHSQRYVKHPFAVVATEWKDVAQSLVGLATHATVDHLYHLADSVQAWMGPISIAVFTPDVEYQLARIYIRYLRSCFPELRRKVSFHFVHPVEWPARWEDGPMAEPIVGCGAAPRAALLALLARRPPEMLKRWRNELPYPQNLMRNLARFTCPGTYLLCPDVDMVVTLKGLDSQLAEFLGRPEQRKCVRCAYVVPVYEVREGQKSPANKTELLELIKAKNAQQFHLQVFKQNQGLSKLTVWEDKGQGEALNVSHKVEKFAFFFEPIYVAARNVPPFDERFVGFGHTRNTQAYEMFLAGWQFSVLNNVFLVHWGFQKVDSRPPWRERQAITNSRRFAGFLREVAVRYDRDPLNMLSKYAGGKYNIVVNDKLSPVAAAPKPALGGPAVPAPPGTSVAAAGRAALGAAPAAPVALKVAFPLALSAIKHPAPVSEVSGKQPKVRAL